VLLSRSVRAAWFAFAALVVLAAPGLARADVPKPQCIDENTQGQTLRRDGKLAAARAHLRTCSDASCPEMVRVDCSQRLDELERVQPTILFDAKDADGRDLVAVQVTLDGQPFTDKLDGKALPADPGVHTFTFTIAGVPPVTRTLVLKEGEKERRERIVLGPPAAAPSPSTATVLAGAPAVPPSEVSPPASPSGLGAQRLLGLVAGGAGVVGIGVGAVFGLMASSAWNGAKSACGGDTSRCADVGTATSDRSNTVTDGTISTVAFVAGAALVAGGAVLYFTGRPSEPPPTASVAVAPVAAPGQGGLALVGRF
jgi:hypothetical protein